jgi:3-oxoacyl-[acyl-carrier-protein] synthase III
MKYVNVCIEQIACVLPDEILSSERIERMLKPLYDRLHLPTGRLELMTGIRERRLWPKHMRPSEASAQAGEATLEKAGIARRAIDAILHCSVSRDFVEPATSTAVHRLMKLPNHVINFDISNACLGVLSGVLMMANMVELGQIQRGLVVAGENSRPLVENTINHLNTDTGLNRNDIKPWFASLTIGSAAVGILVSHKDLAPKGHSLLGGVHRCNTEFNHLCQGGADSGMGEETHPLMQTDSEQLLVQGVALAAETWKETKNKLGWTNQTPDVVCTHQVGKRHRMSLYEAIGLDPELDFATVETLGNCGAVSLPATVALAEEAGRLSPGDTLAMLGIGSGINCLMLGVEW